MATLWLNPPRKPLKGFVKLPYSKSLSNRQLLLGAHTGRPFSVKGLSVAEDTLYVVQALRLSGYTLVRRETEWEFRPPTVPPPRLQLFLGEGGTTLRFLLPWLVHFPTYARVDVAPSLRRRPVHPLIESLRSAGAKIQTLPGLFPLLIEGDPEWLPDTLSIDSSLSSQFVSALFLLAPHLRKGAFIEERSARPATPSYREVTRRLLHEYGWEWQLQGNGWELVSCPSVDTPLAFYGEPDWSSASFFFGWAALMPAQLELPLQPTAFQPESRLFPALPWPYRLDQKSNALFVENTGICIPSLDIDVSEFPDAALVLAVVSAFASSSSCLRGVHTLPHKESHRIEALATELARIGVRLSWEADTLYIEPIRHLPSTSVEFDSHGDHRLAMALSLIAARSQAPIGIREPYCVAKSFPTYWRVLARMGLDSTFVL